MTSWSTVVISLTLIGFEVVLWGRHYRLKTWHSSKQDHTKIWRSIHVLERLINAFSDQQSVAGLSLIVVAGHDGCEISAYVYNVVCFLIVMSLITHLNALTNTRNWFESEYTARGIVMGVFKLLPILATVIMAGIMLGARNSPNFPVNASEYVRLSASCFESVSEVNKKEIGFGGFARGNWASAGFIQYMILMVDLCVVSFLFTLALLKKFRPRPEGFREILSLGLRTLSTLATTGTLAWLSYGYIEMRKAVENASWFEQEPASNQFSYYNVVTWALFASSVITIVNAFAEVYKEDPRAGDAAANGVANGVTSISEKFDKAEKGSPPADFPDLM